MSLIREVAIPRTFPRGKRLGFVPLGKGDLQGVATVCHGDQRFIALSSSAKGGVVLVGSVPEELWRRKQRGYFPLADMNWEVVPKPRPSFGQEKYGHPGGISFTNAIREGAERRSDWASFASPVPHSESNLSSAAR